MKLREAVIEDAPALARILTGASHHAFQGRVPDHCLDSPTLAESERNWRRSLAEKNWGHRFMLILEDETESILGYIIFSSKTERANEAELDVLMIDVPKQRQGYGRYLVQVAANRVRKLGCQTMLVGVEQHNPNAAFYERLGAEQVGERALDWDGFQTREILYRWEDLDELSRLTPV